MNVGLGHYWPVCGQSPTSSENGREPCRGAIGASPTGSHQKFIVSGQVFPWVSPHCPRRFRAGEEAAGRAGWGFRGTTALCREGASPLPGPHPPGRCPPRSTARVSRGTIRVPHPPQHGWGRSPESTWGFNRTCTSPIANQERKCTHVVSSHQWGPSPSPHKVIPVKPLPVTPPRSPPVHGDTW
jgi:hypothetical protein